MYKSLVEYLGVEDQDIVMKYPDDLRLVKITYKSGRNLTIIGQRGKSVKINVSQKKANLYEKGQTVAYSPTTGTIYSRGALYVGRDVLSFDPKENITMKTKLVEKKLKEIQGK